MTVFDRLLQSGEGTTLDFKRDAYHLNTLENKGEFIKDILAFANASHAEDTYILIGVQEGPPAVVVGVTNHPNNASLQQLVNSKTHRPVVFSYEVFATGGVQVGVVRNPKQERPLFLSQNFGRLNVGSEITITSDVLVLPADQAMPRRPNNEGGLVFILSRANPDYNVEYGYLSTSAGDLGVCNS